MDKFFDAISNLWTKIKNFVKTIIRGIMSFVNHVVGWFKGLRLKKNRDVPFIANANSDKFREMLHSAPVKNVGIFEGVYNEETDEITDYKYIEADGMDAKISETLGGDDLVVLS